MQVTAFYSVIAYSERMSGIGVDVILVVSMWVTLPSTGMFIHVWPGGQEDRGGHHSFGVQLLKREDVSDHAVHNFQI